MLYFFMEIYINIDGVLRNTIQKFDYHYKDFFLERDEEPPKKTNINDDGEEGDVIIIEPFDYGIDGKINNDDLLKYYRFQSVGEFNNFTYIEFPIDIFGHAGVSYSTAMSDLNKLIYENLEHNFTIVGIDNLGKAKSASLFFLSKNGCLVNNIKFISQDKIDNSWNNCDIWITDDKKVIDTCPKNKIAIKFNTSYNDNFSHLYEINKLEKIEETWLTYLEKNTTSTLKKSQKNVKSKSRGIVKV